MFVTKSVVYIKVRCLAVMYLEFDKCIISCVHHDSIPQKSWIALKVPVLYLFVPCLPTPGNTDLYSVSILLPFLECRVIGIHENYGTEYIAFSGWLLSLINMYLRVHYVFLWLNSSFLFFSPFLYIELKYT